MCQSLDYFVSMSNMKSEKLFAVNRSKCQKFIRYIILNRFAYVKRIPTGYYYAVYRLNLNLMR